MEIQENLDQPSGVASLIDQTLLKPDATRLQIVNLCSAAREHSFATVCVNPYWVALAARELAGCKVKACTVVGFPLGANERAVKVLEARQSLTQGATELDMVLNIGSLRSGELRVVEEEIRELVQVAHGGGAFLKVILETCLLDDEQKRAACRMALEAGADFVKTSTGFSSGGATLEDVRLMRSEVGAAAGVKASGGIRSLDALRKMVHAGANRIGTSSGVEILRELAAESGLERSTIKQSPSDY